MAVQIKTRHVNLKYRSSPEGILRIVSKLKAPQHQRGWRIADRGGSRQIAVDAPVPAHWDRARARCGGDGDDRGPWAKQPQRHCGFAPGSRTGRVAPAATAIAVALPSTRSGTASWHQEGGPTETGTGMTKGDTVPSAPLRGSVCLTRSWVVRARGIRLSPRKLHSIRQSQLGAGIEAAGWLGLAGTGWLGTTSMAG